MDKQVKKLHNIKESSDAVFQEIFGFGKKTEEPSQLDAGSGYVKKLGEGTYILGKGGIVSNLRGVSEHLFINYDFKNSPLAWLLDAKFEGELTLKLTGQPELTAFVGKWYEGTFKGKFFGQTSQFIGGQFGDIDSNPVFSPQYTNWKPSPWFFYDGIIKNPNGGILGIQDLAPGKIDYAFNILAFKPGTSITLELNNGVTHVITCTSRLGGNSRVFSYNVLDGNSKETKNLRYDWSDIRGGSKIDFHKNTSINFQSASGGIDVFKLDVSAGIKSATVAVAGTSGAIVGPEKQQIIDFTRTQQKYDVGQIPILRVKAQPRGPGGKMMSIPEAAKGLAYLYIPDQSYMSKFEEVKNNIESGLFQKDVSLIKGALKNKIITGFDNTVPYLASVLPQGSTQLAPKEIKESLKRLEDFIRFFIERIYVQGDNGKEDIAKQDLIINKLKSALGVPAMAATQQATPETPSKPEEKIGKINIPESKVREAIRKIISENM